MNALKKILVLVLPFMLFSCTSKTPSPPDQSSPTVASETIETPDQPIVPSADKAVSKKPTTAEPKPATENNPDTEVDEMAQEIDSIFDELING